MNVQPALFAKVFPKLLGGEPAPGEIGQRVKNTANRGGGGAARRDGPGGEAEDQAQTGTEQLPFPFASVFVGVVQFRVALDELGEGQVAPAPETRRGGAGDAGDGGGVAFALDGDVFAFVGGKRDGAGFAVFGALEEAAGEGGLGVFNRLVDLAGQGGFVGAAKGGDGDFFARGVDVDGFERGVRPQGGGEGADEASRVCRGGFGVAGGAARHGKGNLTSLPR